MAAKPLFARRDFLNARLHGQQQLHMDCAFMALFQYA